MSRVCTVCTHAKRTLIEAQLKQGLSFRKIAKLFKVSPAAVQRHHKHMDEHAVKLIAAGLQTSQQVAQPLEESQPSAPVPTTAAGIYDKLITMEEQLQTALQEAVIAKSALQISTLTREIRGIYELQLKIALAMKEIETRSRQALPQEIADLIEEMLV